MPTAVNNTHGYLSMFSGNKMNNIEVVYTMWENLKKTGSMDVGQVGFHKHKEVPFSSSKLVFDQQLLYFSSYKMFF